MVLGQVWKAVGAVLAQLSVAGQLAAILGAALLVLAALEGAHLLLFPRRVQKRLAGRYLRSPDRMPD
jgi:hypothetical protein